MSKSEGSQSDKQQRPRPGEGTDCQLGPHHCEFPECSCPRTVAPSAGLSISDLAYCEGFLSEAAQDFGEPWKEVHAKIKRALDAASTPPSARKESSMNTCPTCGADLHGRPDWALREAEHNLRIFALIEEVEALRKGVSVTHVNGDPIPAVRAALGDKQYFVDCLTRLRATVGPTAKDG